MVNILLIHAKSKQKDRFVVYPPFGIMYLSSVLKNNCYNVSIYDMNLHESREMSGHLNHIKNIIETKKVSVIGIGGMTSSFVCVKELTAELKERYPKIPLVGGGLIISMSGRLVMENTLLDVGCIGEAEEIIVELMDRIIHGKDMHDMEGLIIRREGGTLYYTQNDYAYSRRRKRSSLDYIPYPDHDAVDMGEYLKRQEPISNVMPIFSGRGCPYHCTFCNSAIDKKPVKFSVNYVIKHMDYLNEKYGIIHFKFMDENFNLNRQWVIDFCRAIIDGNKPYTFTTGNRNRAEKFDKELLEAMKAAHFYEVSIGVESLDDGILRKMNRGSVSRKIMDALKMIKDAGLDTTHIRCLYGFPADSKKSIYGSIRKGNAIGYKTLFCMVMPLPGTRIYNHCVNTGLIADEVKFMEELYHGNGYRNMTKFNSLDKVMSIINEANAYSEADYLRRKHHYLAWIKTRVWFYVRKCLRILRDVSTSK